MARRSPPRPVPAGHRLQQRKGRTVQGSVLGLIMQLGDGGMGDNDVGDLINIWENSNWNPLRVDD